MWKKEGQDKYLFLNMGDYDGILNSYKWLFGTNFTHSGNTMMSERFDLITDAGCPISTSGWSYRDESNGNKLVEVDLDITCISTIETSGMNWHKCFAHTHLQSQELSKLFNTRFWTLLRSQKCFHRFIQTNRRT